MLEEWVSCASNSKQLVQGGSAGSIANTKGSVRLVFDKDLDSTSTSIRIRVVDHGGPLSKELRNLTLP